MINLLLQYQFMQNSQISIHQIIVVIVSIFFSYRKLVQSLSCELFIMLNNIIIDDST